MDVIKEISEGCLLSSLVRFEKILKSPKSHKKVVIEKNGKTRTIFVPNKIVKMAQRFYLDNYLSTIKCHPNCFSYQKGKSTLSMVEHHKGNKYFLHLDIKHYFDSMDWDLFVELINRRFPSTKLAQTLDEKNKKDSCSILTFRKLFRQGSVTSPYISNLYLYEFDEIVSLYVNEKIASGKYTRYSDDLIISSSKRIDNSIINFISEELKKYHLRLNYKKVNFSSLNSSVKIVGLSLKSNGDITIPTIIKTKTKDMIYKLLEKDISQNFNVLFGYLYYIYMCY